MKSTQKQDDEKTSRKWLRTAVKSTLDEFTSKYLENPPRYAKLIRSLYEILDLNSKSRSKNRSSRRKKQVNYSEESVVVEVVDDGDAPVSHSQVSTTTINLSDSTIDLVDVSIENGQQNEFSIVSIPNNDSSKDLEIVDANPSSTINLDESININININNNDQLASFNLQDSDEIWLQNFPNDDDDNDDEEEEQKENVSMQNDTSLFLPGEMKTLLDSDYYLVTVGKKLGKIPSSVCVIDILEIYIKYFGLKAILKWWEEIESDYQELRPKPAKKSKLERKHQKHEEKKHKRASKIMQDNPVVASTSTNNNNNNNNDYPITSNSYNPVDAFEQVEKSVDKVKSKMDDIRILFDYLLNHCLLYPGEKPHYDYNKMCRVEKTAEINNRNNKVLLPLILQCKKEFSETLSFPLGSSSTRSSENPQPSSSTNLSNDFYGLKLKARLFVNDLLAWRLLPDSEYNLAPTHPSLLFGMVHLTRLIVTMPEILSKMKMKAEHLNANLQTVNAFTRFLNDFSDRFELLAQADVVVIKVESGNGNVGNGENSSSFLNETILLD